MWVTIPNFTKYQVNHLGRVRRARDKRRMKLLTKPDGYKSVSLLRDDGQRKHCAVHRLVCMAFLDGFDQSGPKKLSVDHINRRRGDNRLCNLRLATPKQQYHNRVTRNLGKGHRIPVEQWTTEGVFMERYASHEDASTALGKGKHGAITLAARSRGKGGNTGYGFVWKRVKPSLDLEGEVWKHYSKHVWISNKGRYKRIVRNLHYEPKSVCDMSIQGGYPMVDKCRLHRLVAMLHLPPPTDPAKWMVNHIDGDKMNADVSNLEWCTPKENTDHAFRTGLCKRRTSPVVCMDKDNNVIKRYSSIKAAQQDTGVTSLGRVIARGGKTRWGVFWKYL